nr:aldo/keto reductase [Desulfogranum marinum]
MIYRRFGKTELEMPVFSAGGMRFMQSWQDVAQKDIEQAQQKKLQKIIAGALDLGINHVETARGYGSSERQLGLVLKEYERENFIVQTKVEPVADPLLFREHVLDSLRRLQVERVDLLALHGINSHKQLWHACRPGGCLHAARLLQKQGKVDWVGFSGHASTDVLLQAVNHDQDGGFDYINLHWYTIFQRNEKVLEAASEQDMGTFIISPTDKGGMLHTPPLLLEELSAPLTPMQFNDLFCLQHKAIHTISIGAAKPDDFTDHVLALQYINDFDLVGNIYQRWQKRMLAVSGNCSPDNHWEMFPGCGETPGCMNIPMILWLYNLATGWDLLAYAQARYSMLGKGNQWVPGNNAACIVEDDVQVFAEKFHLPARELLLKLQQAHELLVKKEKDNV